jgi:hypothetical protein
MYNRYIRNDNGVYTRIPQEEPPPREHRQEPHQERSSSKEKPPEPEMKRHRPEEAPRYHSAQMTDGLTGFLRHILDQLHLNDVDTGDLLLLGLLFFLSREDADEELLAALGLLLIL